MSTEHQQPLRAAIEQFPIRGDALLWSGLFVEFVGIAADAYWHHVLGIHEVGTIPFPHWITITGMLVALAGTIDSWRSSERFETRLYGTGFVAGVVQILGAVWDNWLHLTGVEPEPWALPHAVYRLGFVVLLVVAIAALVRSVLDRSALSPTP